MRIRYIVTLLLTGSIISGTALFFLFLNVAPTNSAMVPVLFTILFFFFILGIISTLLISIRSRGENAWRAQFNLNVSMRQGTVIGALAVICLWLAHLNLLTFWMVFLIVFIAGFIEYRLLPQTLRT